MGWAGTAMARPHFGALSDSRVLSSLVSPRARTLDSHENAPAALALLRLQFGRLAGHDGKSQLGAGRNAERVATLYPASKESRLFGSPEEWGPDQRCAGAIRPRQWRSNPTPSRHSWRPFPSRALRPGSGQPLYSLPTGGRVNTELAPRPRKPPASTRAAPARARAFVGATPL